MLGRFLLLGMILGLFCPALAHGQVTVTIFPSVGPDAGTFGNPSPNLAGYNNNAINALYQTIPGVPANSTILTPSSAAPAAYSVAGSTIPIGSIISTPFNSWLGVANPGGAYAGEFGNSLYFGAILVSNDPGTVQFSLDSIEASIASSDPTLNVPASLLSGDYSDSVVGVIANNGQFGAGDTFVTSGLGSQNVDAILLLGTSTGYNSAAFTNQNGGDQAIINNGIAQVGVNSPITITGTYTVIPSPGNNFTGGGGSGSVNATVPEPASVVAFGIGLAFLFVVYRRRRPLAGRASA
jgi:hypothetical protein